VRRPRAARRAEPLAGHLAPGESFDYPDRPAAAGPHDASPLPPDPHVYAIPVPETRAVHNLEHAYVIIYYRPVAEGGLAQETSIAWRRSPATRTA
jgi:hypothetical protein